VIRQARRALLLVAAIATFQSEASVVVESMAKDSALEQSGVKAGDLLVGWKQGQSAGEFHSTIDVALVENEYSQRPGFVLRVQREGKQHDFSIPQRQWLVQTGLRPALSMQELEAYQQARAAVAAGRWKEGLGAVEKLAESLARQRNVRDSVWLLYRVANAHGRSQRFVESARLIDIAVRRAEAAGDPKLTAWILYTISTVLWDWGQYPESERRATAALRIHERLAPESATTANTLRLMARLAAVRNDLDEARRLANRMLAMTRATVAGSLLEAEAHHQLGNIAYWSDDTDEALTHLGRALAIRSRADPKGYSEALSLMTKGHVHRHRGELQVAQQHYEQAEATYQRIEPESPAAAEAKMSLGYMAHERRDLAAAILHLSGAIAIYERYAPGALGTEHLTKIHAAMGELYRLRGDLPAARVYLERSFAQQRRVATKSSFETSATLANLAEVALEQRDLAAAARYQAESVTVARELGSAGAHLGARLLGLARIEMISGERASAHQHLAEAERILARRTPHGLPLAEALTALGEYYLDGEDPALARPLLARAADMVARIAPGTTLEARPLYLLSGLERTVGNTSRAGELLEQALDALESQRTLLGRSDNTHVRCAERYAPYYLDYIDLLVELGKAEQAFTVLERYRARALIEAFLSRSEIERTHVPPTLAQSYERALYRYDRAFEQMRRFDDGAKANTGFEDVARELREARVERNALDDRIRVLEAAQPASALTRSSSSEQIRSGLPADAILLSYVSTRSALHLFVASRTGIRQRVVTQNVAPLWESIDALGVMLRAHPDGDDDRAHLIARLASLHDTLVGPVAAELRGKRQIVIVSDGILHRVPWSALVTSHKEGSARYLLHDYRITVAPSATFHLKAAARQQADAGADLRIVAFANTQPAEDQIGTADASRSRGQAFLPSALAEASAIRTTFGTSARVFTGLDATESRAKDVAASADVLHFAAHAIASEDSPLDSFITLGSASRNENGLLQAWEVMTQMRLRSRIVVLSACDTASGRDAAGEGLIGLTRAFHYAGAPSVIASLWPVNDKATAALMKSFYQALAAGELPDEALREAQLEMLDDSESFWLPRRRHWNHPFYWAGFQLSGAAAR
jgi:CHAT domain-containing protein/ATP/maltotriose-dependent transcriptional regulator MalT